MKFKQLQALKKRAYQAFADGKRLDVPDQDAAHLDSINLAFVGDAYYALTLRRRLVETRWRRNSYPPRLRPMSTAASTTA